METIDAIRDFLTTTYTLETLKRSLTDYRLLIFPVLSAFLLFRRIGSLKTMLYSGLSLAVIVALWSQMELGGPAPVIAILAAILAISVLYFIYLLTIGTTVRN